MLIFFLAVAIRLVSNQTPSPVLVAPLWTADLLEPEADENPSASMQTARDSPGVTFLDNNRLIVYETGPTGRLSSRGNPDITSAFRLHATVIDPASGKLIATKDWGARPYGSWIQVTSTRILVRTGEVLRILSHDFSEVQRWTYTEVPDTSDPKHCDKRTTSVSPTGDTVMINCYNFKLNLSHLEVWDSNLSRSKYSWDETREPDTLEHWYSISDTGIAGTDIRQQNIALMPFGGTTWTILDMKTIQRDPEAFCANFPTLVTDTRLVNICSSGLLFVSTEGHVLMTDSLDEMGIPSRPPNRNIAISQNGQRIAISFDSMQTKKGSRRKDSEGRVSTHLLMYDFTLRRRVLNLNITPLPGQNYDFALSPDGSKLAVLNARNVAVYSVPVE